MKKISFILLFLLLVTIGCSAEKTEPNPPISVENNEITGYVLDIKDGNILVVDPKLAEIANDGGRTKDFHRAIWLSNTKEKVSIGQKVKVSYGDTLVSYPAKSEALSMEIVESNKPKGAVLSEQQVISKAIGVSPFTEGVTIIKKVTYNKSFKNWSVLLKNAEKEITIEVIDE